MKAIEKCVNDHNVQSVVPDVGRLGFQRYVD